MSPKDPMRTDNDKLYAVHIQAFDFDIICSNGPSTKTSVFCIIAVTDVEESPLSVEIDDSLRVGFLHTWLSAGLVIEGPELFSSPKDAITRLVAVVQILLQFS